MEHEVKHDQDDMRFYIVIDEEEAELTYSYTEDNDMDFDHTFVPESARGQGIAHKLARHGLDYARENNCKAIASCPAVEAFVKRNPEYNDIMLWP
ncbi:GNAT family N-acetyltransferase [Pontibacter fetidus]|uniref:N-acetyltransferase n=1 Tax=Pontibacter fetidus TaxID=2700082 RepID=A0A6B2H999_9BACT|nr:GNAT family N-acetyltransferase [Pontibacter fetidus]NDK55824.1 N-acetyltransferase [Pontibacter fetidus]